MTFGGSKVIRGIIAWKEGKPENEAYSTVDCSTFVSHGIIVLYYCI